MKKMEKIVTDDSVMRTVFEIMKGYDEEVSMFIQYTGSDIRVSKEQMKIWISHNVLVYAATYSDAVMTPLSRKGSPFVSYDQVKIKLFDWKDITAFKDVKVIKGRRRIVLSSWIDKKDEGSLMYILVEKQWK